jgi:hypothetical protein
VQLVRHPAGIGHGELELQAKRPAVGLGPPRRPEGEDAIAGIRDTAVGLDRAAGQPPLDRQGIFGQPHQGARADEPGAGER